MLINTLTEIPAENLTMIGITAENITFEMGTTVENVKICNFDSS